MRNSFFILIICLSFKMICSAQNTKPNILLILVDDLGYNDVSYYGNKDIKTPNLDALCKAGIRFDNFYANSPVCSPTRASLMSGKYPDAVGVPGLIRYPQADNWGYLKPEIQLLPAALKEIGYETSMVGKWNLGLKSPNLPNQKGFDYFHGWLEDMMEDYYDHKRHGINFMRENLQEVKPEGHATDIFTNWSIDIIKKSENIEKPFFLYLAYNAPHFPVQPPKEWHDRVVAREPSIDPKRGKLVALIEHLDASIGRVVMSLKESKQYENTLIIFVSDNGGNLPDLANNLPYRDGKQSMYEGGLRVPAFATWPAKIKSGIVSKQQLMTMDIFPTLIEVANSSVDRNLDGISFKEVLLLNETQLPKRPVYFVRREGGIKYGGNAYHALIYQGWKILQNTPYSPLELYHIEQDPYEKQNLAAVESNKLFELNKILMTYKQKGGKTPWQNPEKNE